MARGVSSFQGKSGLLYQRNLIDSISNFSDALSKEFQEKYGIPVKFYFSKRNMGEITLKFRPSVSAAKLKESGIPDLTGTLKSFVLKKLPSIDSFIMKAIHDTMGKSITSTVSITDSDGKESSTSWINATKVTK